MKPAPVQPSLFDPPKGDCPQCDGEGSVNEPETGGRKRCPNCNGSGSVTIPF